jgi:hypothetical protein
VVLEAMAELTQITPGVLHGSAARAGDANAPRTQNRISSAEINKADGKRLDLFADMGCSLGVIRMMVVEILVVPGRRSAYIMTRRLKVYQRKMDG